MRFLVRTRFIVIKMLLARVTISHSSLSRSIFSTPHRPAQPLQERTTGVLKVDSGGEAIEGKEEQEEEEEKKKKIRLDGHRRS